MFSRFIDDSSAGPSSIVAMTPDKLQPSPLKSTMPKSMCEKYVIFIYIYLF
jgi:hypothetical protein